jgi:acetyl esterase/lipase
MIYDAVEDARAAVRWVRSVAEDQRLDTDRIILMGESAGAVTSLYYGYVKQAQYEGNSGNPGFSSAVAAVVGISGELKSQGYCDSVHPFPRGCKVDYPTSKTNDVTGKDQVPMMLIAGTEDPIVPYVNTKEVFYRAQDVGLPSALVTIQGAQHVPFTEMFLPKYFTPIM